MIKKIVAILILLLVIVVLWIGMSVYESKFVSTVNPNAQTYMKPISPSFKLGGFNEVMNLQQNLVAKPEDLYNLEEEIEQ